MIFFNQGKLIKSTQNIWNLVIVKVESLKYQNSKETVVLRQWESETWKFGFIKRVDKSQITTMKDLESWRFEGSPFSSERIAELWVVVGFTRIWKGLYLYLALRENLIGMTDVTYCSFHCTFCRFHLSLLRQSERCSWYTYYIQTPLPCSAYVDLLAWFTDYVIDGIYGDARKVVSDFSGSIWL